MRNLIRSTFRNPEAFDNVSTLTFTSLVYMAIATGLVPEGFYESFLFKLDEIRRKVAHSIEVQPLQEEDLVFLRDAMIDHIEYEGDDFDDPGEVHKIIASVVQGLVDFWGGMEAAGLAHTETDREMRDKFRAYNRANEE